MAIRHSFFAVTLASLCALSFNVHADTSMSVIVEENDIQQCKIPLLAIADELIGTNVHRLHVDQPKQHADKYPFTVVGVISYKDDDAQVQFNAFPMVNGECEVSYQEVFESPENCLEVREQIFKKWEYVGRLSKNSFFLRHKERLTKNATLTSVKSGTECLVTRRHSGF
ncbi:hypothetical protein [Marinomonas sp. IMCC 4694]|uniref:hypothetical protein n=1 Tax=Marinomonas sp. IMCC 4694 TaxID=2605432 RepID=UPI0011E65D48|nr:hypothetical protein [Marinomonas sp. IMCC 4694]TYL46534.1 hypothetical protein FXV75_00410 [Marinomonas sp. IMCC 4694]